MTDAMVKLAAANRPVAPADVASVAAPGGDGRAPHEEALDPVAFLRRDFERRIRNLTSLDSQSNHRPTMLCFNTLGYVISANRLQWALQQRALQRVGRFAGGVVMDPDTFNVLGAFRIELIVRTGLYAVPSIWSLLVLDNAFPGVWVFNVAATVTVLLLPLVWFHRAMLRRQGFPSHEPFGAAFLDLLKVLKPSLP